MEIQKEFYDMICSDIAKIDKADTLSPTDQYQLHRELDGKYQVCIKDWRMGLWGSSHDGSTFYYNQLLEDPASVAENLQMMKAKLETFKFQMNAIAAPEFPKTHINVTTNVGIYITFEQVRSQIEGMSSLTDEQTREVLEKISEIEETVKSTDSKKNKWEKIKPILKWLADKSCDVGVALLPLILQI